MLHSGGSNMTFPQPAPLPSLTSTQDPVFAVIILTGVVGHVLFNRLEPQTLSGILCLLLGPPTAIALLLLRDVYSGVWLALAVAASCSLYVGALVVSVVVYRLSPFHPLARFSGPVICRISRLWAFYIVHTGKQHLYYQSLHRRYGTHVRTGPNHLLVCDAAAVPAILGPSGFPRGGRYEVTRPPGSVGSLLSLTDVDEHARRRRLWERSMNSSAIQGYQDMLVSRIHQLSDAIERQEGVVLDLSMWLSCFSFDFMGDMAFGGAFRLMEQGSDVDGYMHLAHLTAKYQEMLGTIGWVRPFRNILSGSNSFRRYFDFAKESVLARKALGSARKDIFHYLLDEEENKVKLSLPTLVSESAFAIGAGSDTTGTTLANMFFNLIAHPDVLQRLRAEVDEAFPTVSDVFDPKALAELRYLNAVIHETLRLWPAVPNGVQRVIPRGRGGATIAGRWVPAGTTVQVPTFSLHRDPRYFAPDPDSFRPERWLDGTHDQVAAYNPFSYGPMSCVGKNLAMQELRMVTCALLRRFEFRFAPGWEECGWEQDLCDAFILTKGCMPVVAETRK